MTTKDPPAATDRQPLTTVVLVNCVLAGLGTLYVATSSELVTLASALVVSLIVLITMTPGASRAFRPVTVEKGSGVEESFDQFYAWWRPRLIAILIARGCDPATAAETADEAMTELLTGWESVRHPRTWSVVVASRKVQPHAPLPKDESAHADRAVADWSGGVDTLVVLREVLAELPPKQRDVLLFSLAGMKPAEIADELGADVDQVRANLKYARRRLRQHLEAGEEA